MAFFRVAWEYMPIAKWQFKENTSGVRRAIAGGVAVPRRPAPFPVSLVFRQSSRSIPIDLPEGQGLNNINEIT